MANKNPNTEKLLNSIKEKTDKTKQKVEKALKEMLKKQRKINFNSVAEEAGVSKGFLYKHEEIRERIETLRKQQEGLSSPKQLKREQSDKSKDVIIESLKKKIKELEKENKDLKEQLKTNLGNIYKDI